MKPGKLVVVEGIDDSGKSTLAEALRAALETHKIAAPLILREPSPTTPLGKFVRDRLGAPPPAWTPEAWACATVAAMLEQDFTARSWVERGGDVVYDRRELSTLVYQGDAVEQAQFIEYLGEGCTEPQARAVAEGERRESWTRMAAFDRFLQRATASLAPVDLLVWLDCPPEVAAARKTARAAKDQEAFSDLATARRLAAGYAREFEAWPGPKLRLNAEGTSEQLVATVMVALDAMAPAMEHGLVLGGAEQSAFERVTRTEKTDG